MTTRMNQICSRLDQTGARTALVRGASAPSRPPDTVTLAPGIARSVGPDGRSAPLYVTAQAPSGRTVREYDGAEVGPAADCAEDLTAARDPRAVWLCERDQIRSWWSEEVADFLERRLADAARQVDARLVVWTGAGETGDETHGEEDPRGPDRRTENDAAATDRYDVVLDR
ncbi:hypothetical protein [Halorussus lipolyticus]|uniref:hypothetical protein n=1 Tax=Halorussus lipolyticus TaxID=3034024 RepID=UPI0023E867E9|nr:hypothetical protein [Halorussus sp. DT80]